MNNKFFKLPIGSDLPDFWLPDIEGTIVPRDRLLGAPAILVIFMCNHSPFVKHIREVLIRLTWEYQQRGVVTVAINSNDITQSPEDSPAKMKEESKLYRYSFSYLFDGTQEVAKSFRAGFTPDFFIFNKKGKLSYHGQMDDSRPGNGKPVTGKDLRDALNAILADQKLDILQKPGSGTLIKWKIGNEPHYL